MKTLREWYGYLSAMSAAAKGGHFTLGAADQQELLAVLSDAVRTTGGDAPTPAMTVEQRLMRLERSFFDEDEGAWVSEPWRRDILSVSEGAQRDSVDLHKRLAVVEKRFLPPVADQSWALLTTPEMTTAIERLETEVADIRNALALGQQERRASIDGIRGAEKMAEVAQERARAIEIELRGMRKSITQLQQQWQNIRNRLKALLSSAS